MNKFKISILCAIFTIFGANTAKSQGLLDVLGNALGGDTGSTVTNILEGVFSTSNLTVADLAGSWSANGPAVCFQSENFLKQAGGVAAASYIETKLAPYYKQYGLDNATMVIDNAGNFTLTVKNIPLRGVITKPSANKGEFLATFTALGTVKIGSFKTYVQKTSSSMDIMFDASKLKSLLGTIAGFSGNSLAKGASSLLDSYDGLCVGFKFQNTGKYNSTTTNSGNGLIEDGINYLLGGSKNSGTTTKSTNTTGTTKSTTTTKSTKSTGTTKKGRAY